MDVLKMHHRKGWIRFVENLEFQPQFIGESKSEKARLIEPTKNSTAIITVFDNCFY